MPQRLHSQIDTHLAHQSHFHSERLSEHTTLLESIKTNTENINVNVGDVEVNVADMEVLQTATNDKLDTINTTLTSGIGGLPSALTGSGNLKVCIQELGNEGSERLNVDVGNAIAQLPTALTSEGNLKVSIQEDFTHNLSTSAKQDTINSTLGTLSTSAKQDTINSTLGTLSTSAKQDTANGHLSTLALLINPAIATATATTIPGKLDTTNNILNDLASESTLNIIAEEFTKCDTDNVVISGGVVLPSALTGSGNLKVCIQELGNEGAERLNVDIGNAVAQLPTALSGSGRLKIENDFDGVVSGTVTANLSATDNAVLDAIAADGDAIQTKLDTLETTANAIQSAVEGTLTVGSHAVTNAGTFAVQAACSGTVTANLSATDNAVLDEIQTNGDNIQTKLDTIDAQIDLLELSNTIKDVSWLSSVSLSASGLSAVLDTEGYKELTLYGKTTADHGSNLHIFGSSGDGVYFHISTLATSTVGGGYYIKEDTPLNLPNPRYFKIYNADSSTATITLRATLTDKRRYV